MEGDAVKLLVCQKRPRMSQEGAMERLSGTGRARLAYLRLLENHLEVRFLLVGHLAEHGVLLEDVHRVEASARADLEQLLHDGRRLVLLLPEYEPEVLLLERQDLAPLAGDDAFCRKE